MVLLFALACTTPEAPSGPEYIGTWAVADYTVGDCTFPEPTDYGATHVLIDVDTFQGVGTVEVFPCASETDCSADFSDYVLEVDDDQHASGLVQGSSWFDGECDLFWIHATLESSAAGVQILSATEVNGEPVPADDASQCAGLQGVYDGPRACIRSEALALTPVE
ncbi:MAG: hypothetical protein R3F61_33770 [Myxococcota bacterium]